MKTFAAASVLALALAAGAAFAQGDAYRTTTVQPDAGGGQPRHSRVRNYS